jgi:hypothetical protein
MLPILLYYAILLVTAVAAWPHTYGEKSAARLIWLTLGLGILVLPLVAPVQIGVYYGLALNSAMFSWASDSHMDPYWRTKNRRWRGIVGGTLVCVRPAVWSRPLHSWLWALSVPTLGHLLVTGLATPFVRRLASRT